jgi:hypothetical protein
MPYDEGPLEYRLAATTPTLHLPEPVAGLSAPFWIRVELRNPYEVPKELQLLEWEWPRALPFWLHDAFGRQTVVHPGSPSTVSEGIDPAIRLRILAPGETACWHFDLLRDVVPEFNGEYDLRVGHRLNSPALLKFLVTGRPDPIWVRDDINKLGFDPSRVYYRDLQLPEGNRALVRLSAVASQMPDPVVEGLLSRFLGGDQSALIELSRRLSLHQISERLRDRGDWGSDSPTAPGQQRSDLEMVHDEYLDAARDA